VTSAGPVMPPWKSVDVRPLCLFCGLPASVCECVELVDPADKVRLLDQVRRDLADLVGDD
jgi:hypothetical protein